MKMSSGTEQDDFVSTSSLLGDKYSQNTPVHTCGCLKLGVWLFQTPPDIGLSEAYPLQCHSSCSLGEFSWFLANCAHRCIYIQSTRIQWGQWLKYLLTLCGHSWTLPPEENFALSVLAHHICGHRYLDFDGLSLVPARSTKFKPKHPKSCIKKILITVTIFLKKNHHQPPKYLYTPMPIIASQKKKEMACKKNNTFKNNIVNCYSFYQEGTVIAVYKQKRLRKKTSVLRANEVKQF